MTKNSQGNKDTKKQIWTIEVYLEIQSLAFLVLAREGKLDVGSESDD